MEKRWTASNVSSNIKEQESNKHDNLVYRKFPKYSDTQKICCYHSKI